MKKIILVILLIATMVIAAQGLAETAVFHLCPGVDVNLDGGRYTCEGEAGSGLCTLTDSKTGAVYEFDARDDNAITEALGIPVEAFREIIQEQWRVFKDPEMKILSRPKKFSAFMWVPFTAVEEDTTHYHALIFAEGYAIFADLGTEKMEDEGEAIVQLLLKEGEDPATRPTPKPKKTATPEPDATSKPTAKPKATAKPKTTAAPKVTAKPTASPKPTAKPTATPKPTPKPTAAPRPTGSPQKAMTTQLSKAAGYYNRVMFDGKLSDQCLILTDSGMGRLLTDSEISFTYWLEGNDLITDSDAFSLEIDKSGELSVTINGWKMPFSRRTPLKRFSSLSGHWTAAEITVNGKTLSAEEMADSPWNVRLHVYDDGTLDWYPADSPDTAVAGAWEPEDKYLYLRHMAKGTSFKAVSLNNTLKLISVEAPDSLQIIFNQTEE